MRAVGLILASVLVLGALPLAILLGADIQPIQSFSRYAYANCRGMTVNLQFVLVIPDAAGIAHCLASLPCSSVGATSLLATVATAPGTARAYPTALLGRLVSRHRASQDLVRITGSLRLLIDQIQVCLSGAT